MAGCPIVFRFSHACAVAVVLSMMLCGGAIAQPDAPRAAVRPPVEIPAELLAPRVGEEAGRLTMPLEQAVARIEPVVVPARQSDLPPPGLPPSVAELVEQSDRALQRGEYYRAIEMLRQAQRAAPDSGLVQGRLGAAYTLSGNRVRGAVHLGRALDVDPTDLDVLVLLAQHAVFEDDAPAVFGYCDAIERQSAARKLPADLLAGAYRVQVLDRLGYARAAATRLAQIIDRLSQGGAEFTAEALDEDTPAQTRSELRLLAARLPELRLQLGDLYLSLGEQDLAAQQYEQVGLDQAPDPRAVVARRAYLALLAGEAERAADQVVTLLADTSRSPRDAALADYLVKQGVSADLLARRIESAMQERGASIPLLAGYAHTADKAQAVAAIGAWIVDRPINAALLREAAGLITFSDEDPADAEHLAGLLRLTAEQMRREPVRAESLADAVLDPVDALVCLLRAMKQPGLADTDDGYLSLLMAYGYQRAARPADAAVCYERAIELEPTLRGQVRLPLARLLIGQARPADAAALLGEPDPAGPWELFALHIQTMRGLGELDRARGLVDDRLRLLGEDTRARLLALSLQADAGQPDQALDRLFELVNREPLELQYYIATLDLFNQKIGEFRDIRSALDKRRLAAAMLQKNLPDTVPAKLERVGDLYQDGAMGPEAERLLLSVLDQEPDNLLSLSMLLDYYAAAGQDQQLQKIRSRMLAALPPGLYRTSQQAAWLLDVGEVEQAASLVHRTIQWEIEGVLPGRELTGDDAARLLMFMTSTQQQQEQAEPLYLAMVRRFPDNALLNNALGYQWATQGKNLLQAQAMIQRALDLGGETYNVLDSLGWVKYKLGDFAMAEAVQRRAIDGLREAQLRGNDSMRASKAVLYDHMGDILYRQGEMDGAIRHWQIARAQRLDPEDLALEPELRTLGDRVDAKITAVREGRDAPVEDVPGPEAHGPAGHPADPAAE